MFLGGVPASLTSHIWHDTVHGKKSDSETNSFSMKHIIPFFPWTFSFFFPLTVTPSVSFSLSLLFLLSLSLCFLSVCLLCVFSPPSVSLSLFLCCFHSPGAPSVPPFHTSLFSPFRPFYLTLCGTRKRHSRAGRKFAHFRVKVNLGISRKYKEGR